MDWITLREKITEGFKKYRYGLLVLVLGMVLMLWPSEETKDTSGQQPVIAVETGSSEDLQEELEEILGKVEGAGKVRVLLTQSAGERITYQTDEDISTGETAGDIRRETVIITDSGRSQAGLVQQVHPPVYQGAIVLCQGADSAAVRLAIVEAVANATGLTTDKISVLKMKG